MRRITQIKTHAWDNTSVVIVANKCDLKQHRAVDKEDGKRLADDLGISPRPRPPCSPGLVTALQRYNR